MSLFDVIIGAYVLSGFFTAGAIVGRHGRQIPFGEMPAIVFGIVAVWPAILAIGMREPGDDAN